MNYREADTRFRRIARQSRTGSRANLQEIPQDEKDAFFELVLYPVKASAIVNGYISRLGRNRLYASQGAPSETSLRDEAVQLFKMDAELSSYYNHALAGGKWDHMMDQTHIGYTFWNEPPVNNMPKVTRVEFLPDGFHGHCSGRLDVLLAARCRRTNSSFSSMSSIANTFI